MKINNGHNQDKIVKKLNTLLSPYQVAYFNTSASHWMIRGENFFELHKLNIK